MLYLINLFVSSMNNSYVQNTVLFDFKSDLTEETPIEGGVVLTYELEDEDQYTRFMSLVDKMKEDHLILDVVE